MEPIDLKGKRALVAGGSGFIGSHVAERLRAEDCAVRIVHCNNPISIDTDGMEVMQADLRDAEACRRAVTDMDYVFMCAAVTSGAAAIRHNPMSHITPNVIANAQMLDAAHAAGVERFLFVSSSIVYSPADDHPCAEDDTNSGEPYSVYYAAGWMKRYAEILCRTYAEVANPAMSTVVIRPGNIYGPRDKFDIGRSHVTAALIRKVVDRQDPIEVWGTGEDVRDLIYIDDFVEGLVRAFRHPVTHYVANIASGRGVSVHQILQTAMKAGDYADAHIELRLDKPSTIPILLIDTSRAKADLGFQAKTSLEDGIRRTIDWLRRTPQ
ncbi:MAG: NAD-dependent epimerase/dehydratase family protein, partial [Alphaproteobacteria bacterium]|nr:NAD-dependent epimerase/dehydratase family protein [Alphaproteobacteria bacterium]